jgi:hypothetical protein
MVSNKLKTHQRSIREAVTKMLVIFTSVFCYLVLITEATLSSKNVLRYESPPRANIGSVSLAFGPVLVYPNGAYENRIYAEL